MYVYSSLMVLNLNLQVAIPETSLFIHFGTPVCVFYEPLGLKMAQKANFHQKDPFLTPNSKI